MKKILVIGAGRSSAALISYLIRHASANAWHVTVGDVSKKYAEEKIGSSLQAEAIEFNIEKTEEAQRAIHAADLVISLIPAMLHPLVARLCLVEKKHLLTASYVSDEMKKMDAEARASNILFLNECGLDPGIDHMSAMQVIDKIKSEGGSITSFESFTGGLIAPETDVENPWRYKFTWNPRNVVLAGQGTAKYLQDGKFKYVPYQQLFTRTIPISVAGVGEYEGYANRDSLKYVNVYGLQNCKTVMRGTLRNAGYCKAWNILVQLGCCDDTYTVDDIESMTHRDFISSFLESTTAENEIAKRFGISSESEEIKRLKWSGFFSDEKIGLQHATPAQALEHILNKKWKLLAGDKDFIVMWHRFKLWQDGKEKEIQAWLTSTGENETHTAMAKTVGLPLAIAAKLILQNKIQSRGVVIPVTPEFYNPILSELNTIGIGLEEKMIP